MTHTVFIDLDSHVATASATGTAAPDVPLKHLTKQTLAFAFHSGGTVAAVTGWSTGRVVIKATPTSDVLLLDTTLAATGSTTSTRYSAEWAAVDCDSAALRTLIGASVEPLDVFAEIQWTADSGTHAVAFAIQIVPAFNLPEDDPPDPTEAASWTWLKARLAAGSNITFTDNDTTQVRTIASSGGGGGGGGGGSTDWGDIGGTLSDQTDLQTALNNKQPLAAALTTLSSATAAGLALMDDADAAAQRTTLGLGNVNNTSDADKPVSTATQTALDAKVTGPASATDNAIARFDGTTGKLVQNSGATLSDAGVITAPTLQSTPGNTSGAGAGGDGGSVDMRGGNGAEDGASSASGGNGGSILTAGGAAYVDDGLGYQFAGGTGGNINTAGGNASGTGAGAPGGAINTANGGGSIDTLTGIIELGPQGSRTTIQGNNSGDTSILLPPTEGTAGQFLSTDGAGNWDWSTPSGSGDVVGPASSVDADVALFDGTSGKLLEAVGFQTLIDTHFGSTQGAVIYRDSTSWTQLNPGTSGHVLTTGGAAANPSWAAPAGGGKVAQVVWTEDGTGVSTSTNFPLDDTIPQNTEGAEYTQIATTITPTNASSTLIVEAHLTWWTNTGHKPIFALFKDSGADALEVTHVNSGGAGNSGRMVLRKIIAAGSTSAQTFKIRYSSSSSGGFVTYINEFTTAYFSTANKSHMSITEILP